MLACQQTNGGCKVVFTSSLGCDLSALDRPEVTACLFKPRPEPESAPGDELCVAVEAGTEVCLRLYLAGADMAHILLFHRRDEIAADYEPLFPPYRGAGVNLLVVDYRGYGRSGGSPSAASLVSDAHLVLDAVIRWLNRQGRPGPLVIMGRGLGCVPAIELASCRPTGVRGLILDDGFARTMPFLRRLGMDPEALGLNEGVGFVNFGKIRAVGVPLLVFHDPGGQENPLAEADMLMANAGTLRKQLLLAPTRGQGELHGFGGEIRVQAIGRFAAMLTRLARAADKTGGFDRRYPRRT